MASPHKREFPEVSIPNSCSFVGRASTPRRISSAKANWESWSAGVHMISDSCSVVRGRRRARTRRRYARPRRILKTNARTNPPMASTTTSAQSVNGQRNRPPHPWTANPATALAPRATTATMSFRLIRRMLSRGITVLIWVTALTAKLYQSLFPQQFVVNKQFPNPTSTPLSSRLSDCTVSPTASSSAEEILAIFRSAS